MKINKRPRHARVLSKYLGVSCHSSLHLDNSGVFGSPTGLESNTAEGSATSTDRNRLRRRAPKLSLVRLQA
jgi:hypothetical protein